MLVAKKKKQTLPKVAVIYARYSSHSQKDASIEQQVEECTEFAKENDLDVVETYADRAISGKTDRRPNFQRMMKDAEKGKFAYVIAWKSNRMGRNMLQAMMNEAKLDDLDIQVLYTEENFDNTAAGRFALRSMMNVNQFYSENMAEDIRRGLHDNAINCKVTNGHLPFGYKKGEDDKYAIDEPKDDVVREIFTRVACGDMFVNIADDLNQRGIKTGRGNRWGKGSFQNLVTNERYTGVYIYGDVRVEEGVPQIVDKELFYKVQEVLKVKRSSTGRPQPRGEYLLTGKLFCGKCKSHMVGISGTGRSGSLHYYYVCQKKRLEKICDKKNVRRNVIELAVAVAIKDYLLRDDVIEWMADGVIAYAKSYKEDSGIRILQDQLAEVKKATKNILSAIEQGIVTTSTRERLQELEAEQAQIAMKLSFEHANILEVSRDEIISSLAIYRNGDVNDKTYQAELFNHLLKAVYLYDDKLKLVFNVDGDANSIELPFGSEEIENIESSIENCSYRDTLSPPIKFKSEPVYFINGMLVLAIASLREKI